MATCVVVWAVSAGGAVGSSGARNYSKQPVSFFKFAVVLGAGLILFFVPVSAGLELWALGSTQQLPSKAEKVLDYFKIKQVGVLFRKSFGCTLGKI